MDKKYISVLTTKRDKQTQGQTHLKWLTRIYTYRKKNIQSTHIGQSFCYIKHISLQNQFRDGQANYRFLLRYPRSVWHSKIPPGALYQEKAWVWWMPTKRNQSSLRTGGVASATSYSYIRVTVWWLAKRFKYALKGSWGILLKPESMLNNILRDQTTSNLKALAILGMFLFQLPFRITIIHRNLSEANKVALYGLLVSMFRRITPPVN